MIDHKMEAGTLHRLSGLKIGIIGCGNRAFGIMKQIRSLFAGFQPQAVADIRNDEVRSRLQLEGYDAGSINFYADADAMLSREELDAVIIGTRCSLHTDMALKTMKAGVAVFLEKPVATNMQDWQRLTCALESNPSCNEKIVVSFPLRFTPMIRLVKEIVDSDKIGRVEHVQAVNNVNYGTVYFHKWYRDEKETQGLFLQKATHDLDYINYILGIKPVRLCAMTSKQVYKGNRAAGLKCVDCMEQETCMESPYNLKNFSDDTVRGDFCCFAKDTGNEDSGSVLVEYETGMHVSYSQNFFVKKKAGTRGARFMGHKGTLEFDFMTGEVKVYMHYTPREERYTVETAGLPHYGGDCHLVNNFIHVARGRQKSLSTLSEGLCSTLMCLKAKESALTGTYQSI